uniref:Cadherin-related family member 1 n=1 Tax=Danio rerio TaxID=7955 RepID=A0A286YAQ9_DANRE|nr:cadherin-related family member 2 [Danio rerio]|eukprot:XP_017214654.2 cadherin-related family member 2 [Danio rerio]
MEKPLLLLFSILASGYCNELPEISTSVVILREDLRIGEYAFKIVATDPDDDPLTYKIAGTNAGFFTVEEHTGIVTIKILLDRETNDIMNIDAIVNDGVYDDVRKTIYINVEDANDNIPIFNGLPYNKEVLENTTVGFVLFTASATDSDFGQAGIVSYKIDEVVPDDKDMFSIVAATGVVTLVGNLNFTEKSPFYQIRINASDGGGELYGEEVVQSSSAIAFITVKDVPDIDPQFLNLPNNAAVEENTGVGTTVFTVRARDPDTGVNDKITFSIDKTNASDLFRIDTNTGIVSVNAEIDREELLNISATVVLKIKASETMPNVNGVIASTIGELQISIKDENDNSPEFYECEGEACMKKDNFEGNVNEHSSTGLAVANLNIKVKDLDGGENSTFNLHLDGPDKDAFRVSPTSGMGESTVQVLVKDPQAVDYEIKQIMNVQIIAVDANADFTSTATVTIHLNDTNDNFPTFEKELYKEKVFEHCENGTIVATIIATDADAFDEGKITYRLMPESIRSLFGVHEKTGTIYVTNGDTLDWEVTKSYTLTLQAFDSGNNTGTTVVEISILDINDNAPEMNRDIYEAFVQENEDFKIQIQATDRDEPKTLNSEVQYRISEESTFSSNFTIGLESGLLTNKGDLDREAIDISQNGVIQLIVIASDLGTPSRSSSAKVNISVGDANDNAPRYLDSSPYEFRVKESVKGIYVGPVHAHDADQTDFNNRIFFSITDGSFGSFIIYSEAFSKGYRGNITVDPSVELDYESNRKEYTLKVQASDLGQKSDVAEVHIIVEDVNDTPPEFPSGMILKVDENTTLPVPVDTIKGKDVDTNHSLIYELVSTKCQCNGTIGPCPEEWFIVESNGDIIANTEYVIDYEKCDVVFLTARVVDIYTEVGSNSSEGVVTINIVDINDNAPEFVFLQDFYVVVIEKVDTGTSVARAYATDRDTADNNKKTKFQVNKITFIGSEGNTTESLFLYADNFDQEDAEGRYTAYIRSQKAMDNNKRGKFMVEVEAVNGKLSTTGVVELLTVDSSFRVSLRFDRTVAEVNEALPQVRGILQSATKAMVEIFNVFSDSGNQRAEEKTILEAYFVFPNGSALDYDAVTSILNSEEVYKEFGQQLGQLGFTGISTTGNDPTGVKTEVYIMIGLMAALAIVLVVMTTSLVCIRRNYKRKLKASKAMNSAATVVIQNQKSGPVVPGTNKYTKEGANPVLNMNIDTATDLGFDEDGSSADRESLNSLDYNIDMAMAEKDNMPMMAIQEEEEEDEERSESPYIEPLGAALAQREKKRGADSPGLTFTNHSVDTTDL